VAFRDGSRIKSLKSPYWLLLEPTSAPSSGWTTKFRISRDQFGFDADASEKARDILAGERPDHYDVDEHSTDPFPGTKIPARARGTVIGQKHGQVILEPTSSRSLLSH
jgi:hypothetical protein